MPSTKCATVWRRVRVVMHEHDVMAVVERRKQIKMSMSTCHRRLIFIVHRQLIRGENKIPFHLRCAYAHVCVCVVCHRTKYVLNKIIECSVSNRFAVNSHYGHIAGYARSMCRCILYSLYRHGIQNMCCTAVFPLFSSYVGRCISCYSLL